MILLEINRIEDFWFSKIKLEISPLKSVPKEKLDFEEKKVDFKINFEILLEEIEKLVIEKPEVLLKYDLKISLENYCSIVRSTRTNENILFSSINNSSAYLYFIKQEKKILIYW
jgi:hypothetical protein